MRDWWKLGLVLLALIGFAIAEVAY